MRLVMRKAAELWAAHILRKILRAMGCAYPANACSIRHPITNHHRPIAHRLQNVYETCTQNVTRCRRCGTMALDTFSVRVAPEFKPLLSDIAKALRTRPELADVLREFLRGEPHKRDTDAV